MVVIGRRTPRQFARHGLTLIECMLALMIVPMAVGAVALAIVAGAAQSSEAMRQTRAAMLAEALMEEVLARDYKPAEDSTLGPEAGETRLTYNSPNDFHGLTESAGNVQYRWFDLDGGQAQLVGYASDYQVFHRTVACVPQQISVCGVNVDGLDVTVTVSQGTAPGGVVVVQLKRFVPPR